MSIISVQVGRLASIVTGNELVFIDLPPFGDCTVKDLLEIINRLPDGVSLLLDRHSGCFHILEVENASFSDRFEGGVVKGSSTQDMTNDSTSEILKPHGYKKSLRRPRLPVGDLVIAHRFALKEEGRARHPLRWYEIIRGWFGLSSA